MTTSLQPGATPVPSPSAPRKRPISPRALVEWLVLATLIGAGGVAWLNMAANRRYDYDEIQRAHSVWLASRGLRPYSELFEVHPPYFILLTPLIGSLTDPCASLRILRGFGSAGNLAFLAALVVLGARGSEGSGRDRWGWVGVLFVALHLRVLDYLVEFRIDGWGYALAAWSLVLFLGRPAARGRFITFGGLSGIATLLFSPKLVILPPLVVGFELLRLRPSLGQAVRAIAGYALGVGIARLGFALFLAANRISPDRTYWLLFRYHTLSNAHSAFRHGLIEQIDATRLLLVPILAGAIAWGIDLARRRRLADAYPPAVFAWLAIQALLVSYPYKQYYAPWFLFASAFVVGLGRTLDRIWRPLGATAFIVLSALTLVTPLSIASFWRNQSPALVQCGTLRVLNVLAEPEDRVVAPPSDHPIERHDTFFLWFNTSDPSGYDSERILDGLGPYRDRVSVEQNEQALETHPPAFVVLDAGPVAAPYPKGQWKALEGFLLARRYRVVRMRGLRLALRPDRYQALRGRRLFEDDTGPPAPVMPRRP
jgi:hypothetical protein